MIGVVTSHHNEEVITYTWMKDGLAFKSGPKICCIPVNSSGIYQVLVVKTDEAVSCLSQSVEIGKITDN